jgi:SOS response regulatory protein OraA/RecX
MRIEDDLAKQVIRDQFGDTDEAELLDAALERRLRGKREKLKDAAERRKLIAYLVRQGFSVSAASLAVRRKSREDSQ